MEAPNKGKKAHYYCTECKCFVHKDGNHYTPFSKCYHSTNTWKRVYLTQSNKNSEV